MVVIRGTSGNDTTLKFGICQTTVIRRTHNSSFNKSPVSRQLPFRRQPLPLPLGTTAERDERQNSHREIDLQGVLALCYEALVASERFAQDSAEESHGAEPSVTLLPQSGEAW